MMNLIYLIGTMGLGICGNNFLPTLCHNVETFRSSSYSNLPAAAAAAAATIFLAILFFASKSQHTYLIDFICYNPPSHLRVPIAHMLEHMELSTKFSRESINFIEKAAKRAGISDAACMPSSLHQIPPDTSLEKTREEVRTILFTVIKNLLSKHNIDPKDIDIIVSNCSLFCPTPSITSMVINKFGFRKTVKSFSLGGMGCSAGLVSVSLVKSLLKVYKNSLALVLSMEAVTPNGYAGSKKSMLLTNVLFRMGSVALLLSNRNRDRTTAKYRLQHLVRTHTGSDDRSYHSVIQQPDEDGIVGVSLSRSLLQVASKALRANISKLGPRVLPYSEQFKYVCALLLARVWNGRGREGIYVPNFKKCFDHFCIHAGGRAVIDAVEESLGLSKTDGEASRMTLWRFGNTSSSSVWYELCYLEAKGRVKKGNVIWQIAFGSGFKCNSAVWKCVRDLDPQEMNAWSDRIHLYPIEVPKDE